MLSVRSSCPFEGSLWCLTSQERVLCRTNQIEGQVNLRDAVRKRISFTDPKSEKSYSLKSKVQLCRTPGHALLQ